MPMAMSALSSDAIRSRSTSNSVFSLGMTVASVARDSLRFRPPVLGQGKDPEQGDAHPGRPVAQFVGQLVERLVHHEGVEKTRQRRGVFGQNPRALRRGTVG